MAIDLRLKYWRFGNNGGTESTHTWIGAQNATPPLKLDTTYLLRLGIQEAGGSAAANLAQQFQCNPKGLGWQNITTSSTYVKAVTPTTYANNAASTNRLTGLTGSADATNANCTTDGSSGGTANDVPASGFSETVCGIQLLAADGLVAGDTVQFRCTVSGPTTTITYDVTPSALVLGPVLAATETPTAARAFWPPVEQALDALAETHAASEYAGSSVRVHCIADLEGHKVETGPSIDYETLEATEQAEAGLRFPPQLAAQWAALDKAQTTYRLPHVAKLLEALEETVVDVARQVYAPRALDTATETPDAAIAKAIFFPRLAATTTPEATEAQTISAFRAQDATEAASAGVRFPPRLDATATPETDLGRAVFVSIELAAEAATVADSRESGKLDALAETTAAAVATVLAFRAQDATEEPAAALRFPPKLDATATSTPDLIGEHLTGVPSIALEAAAAATAGLRYPPRLDASVGSAADAARAVTIYRTESATVGGTGTGGTKWLVMAEATASTTAAVASPSIPTAAGEGPHYGAFPYVEGVVHVFEPVPVPRVPPVRVVAVAVCVSPPSRVEGSALADDALLVLGFAEGAWL